MKAETTLVEMIPVPPPREKVQYRTMSIREQEYKQLTAFAKKHEVSIAKIVMALLAFYEQSTKRKSTRG